MGSFSTKIWGQKHAKNWRRFGQHQTDPEYLGGKLLGDRAVPAGVCASKPWSFSSALSRQHRLRAEIWSSEKVDLGRSESTCRTVLLVEQSSPDFIRRTREESLSITSFRFWIYMYPSVPEIFAIKVSCCAKQTLISHVFVPQLFGGWLQ